MEQKIAPLSYEDPEGNIVQHYEWGRSITNARAASVQHRLASGNVVRALPPPPAPIELSAEERQCSETKITHSLFAGHDSQNGGWLYTFRMKV